MQEVYDWIKKEYEENVLPVSMDFVRIPNTSRNFNPNWKTDGMNLKACNFAMDWATKQGLHDFYMEVLNEEGRTPCLICVMEAKNTPTVFMYGHLDKQPPLEDQWTEGRHPYEPVIQKGKLYGRGAADDGYAFFTAILILKALQKFSLPYNRTVLIFETDEESGSKDLLYYLKNNQELARQPSLVICMDSGCVDYEHMCLNTTLRGIINFNLKVSVLNNAIHSGMASGIVPDSFRIARILIEHLESSVDGALLLKSLYVNIPDRKYKQACDLVKEMGGKIDWEFPFLPGVKPTTEDGFKQYINRIWMPEMAMIGVEGVPSISSGGNVIRPYTTIELSIRLPPSLQQDKAKQAVIDFFDKMEKPYNAKVEIEIRSVGQGFDGPDMPPVLEKIVQDAGQALFGKPVLYYGSGGSIPFMNELKELYPETQFIITGVTGPKSNAHGGDECLDIEFVKKLSCSITNIMTRFK